MRGATSQVKPGSPSVRSSLVMLSGVLAVALFALAAGAQGVTSTKPPKGKGSNAEVIPGQYIVTLKPGTSAEALAGETRGRGHKVDHVYKSATKGFSGKLSAVEVVRLSADPRVERIEPDQVVRAIGVQNPAPSWGLDRVDERASDGTSSYTDNVLGTTGIGVTAYVIDTGINAASTDLLPRLAPGANFISSGTTNDCNGHGTHVAGTIGGTLYGVAKGVTLVPVRVLDCGGSGSWSGVIAGLDWVASHHGAGQRAVANLSLGGGFSQAVNDAVKRVVNDGVVVAVAAGNDDADACFGSPSSEPSALTVGATDSADNRASFSNYGPCLDLFAPGVNIKSDWIGSSTATETISGTSMAAPHVAGAAALYLAVGQSAADLVANATTGRVVDPGVGSPDKLLYVGTEPCTPSSCPPPPPPPANDPFAGALELGTATGTTTGSTTNASKEIGEPNHASDTGGRSVWYRFTATSSGTATIDTQGSGFDTLLAAYTGSPVNALTLVAANDDVSGSLQSRVQFSVVANTTYRIAVDGYGGVAGSVKLNWTLPAGAPPPSGNTGFVSPSAQSADAGGDGNGYETGASNTFADDGQFAVDTDSGTATKGNCTSTKKDKHRFSGYGLAVPAGSTVKGIEVQLKAKADSTSGSPKLCVQLSWDGGSTWTSAKSSATLTTSAATYTLGGAADTWRRAWSTTDLESDKFRVRVINLASSTVRDFSLDSVTVRVTY